MKLPINGSTTAYTVLKDIKGKQLELIVEFDLLNSSFCGLNFLCNDKGIGGLFINWSGDILNIDGVLVPIENWKQGEPIKMQIFIDKQLVEVFVNDGEYCVSRLIQANNIKGDNIAITRLGGTAKLISLEAWELKNINSNALIP